jgi:hypothetical protein
VCAVSKPLCAVSDGHSTESGNCSVSNEEKGRHELWRRVSYLKKGETGIMGASLVSQEKGDACYGGVSRTYLTPQIRLSTEYSTRDTLCASTHMPVCTRPLHVRKWAPVAQRMKHRVEHRLFEIFKALRLSWV